MSANLTPTRTAQAFQAFLEHDPPTVRMLLAGASDDDLKVLLERVDEFYDEIREIRRGK